MFHTWSVFCAMLFSCPSRSRDRIWLPCLNLLMMVAPFLHTLRSTYLETFVSLYSRTVWERIIISKWCEVMKAQELCNFVFFFDPIP